MDPSQSPEQRIADFVATLTYTDLPSDAVATSERAFIDTVGVTLAGSRTDAGAATSQFATTLNQSTDGSTLIGRDHSASLSSAVLANGTAGHALDYDDLSWGMDGHPSVPLVAPILGVGELVDATGAEAITAYVAGFETMCFIADPISPTHYQLGWHPTATFGTFGATAAASVLLDLDASTVRRAIAIAASMPAGIKRNFGSMTKPLHAGLAGRSGVTAALLAREGLTADAVPVSGTDGFFDLYADGASESPDPPGNPWRIQTHGIHVKYYPCCYFTHTSITAIATLIEEALVRPDAIKRIDVTASQGAADALVHSTPTTSLQAKFSMEHCIAAAAIYDHVGVAAFEEAAINNQQLTAIQDRVTFTVNPDLAYDDHAATVRVILDDDERYAITQENPPGIHDDPPSLEDLRNKYLACATQVFDESTAASTFNRVSSLADESSIADVMADLSLA